jgi:hypothetical protein
MMGAFSSQPAETFALEHHIIVPRHIVRHSFANDEFRKTKIFLIQFASQSHAREVLSEDKKDTTSLSSWT